MFLLVALFFYTLESNAQGYLRQQGQKLVDGGGNEVLLRGIGLGGWMLQEGYMLKTSGPQHQLEARITELIGETKKAEFYSAWLANHTRKIDIDSMASWGYNAVRLPMHYKLFTPPIEEEPVAGQITWREQGFEMTDQLLAWCKANNMYLILDLHAAPGGQGKNADISDYDVNKPSGGGLNVGYTDSGDYLEFEVLISQAGIYGVIYRVASQSAAGSLKLQLLQNGRWEDLNTQTFSQTGGWQDWKTISGQTTLPQGLQRLRILATSSGFNLNWFEFNYLRPTGMLDLPEEENQLRIYPNPASGPFMVLAAGERPEKLLIIDAHGKALYADYTAKREANYSVDAGLSKGFYVLLFEINGKRLTRKLIVE